MSWTDDRVEMLKTMWGEGKSASQIAKELGGVTRNAVIGKVHRLGLSNRAAPAKTTKEKPAVKEAAKPKPAAKPATETAAEPAAEAAPAPKAAEKPVSLPARKPIITAGQPLPPQPSNSEISAEALATVAEVEKKAKKLVLMELTERTCKWPIGDPATEDFWFCGLSVQTGKPYCEAHNAVAFQPMSARRDRRAR
ncbi:GcrA family cell cycle regulator [Neptunicoccus cionae]|uniref:GcrA family cell cycle regulator n=1 Tax=Neptunicoccus cionae TaxID=2035344 RepID=UPI000C781D93|nr:GcrA family cell cycle regulator [Amylibacter cionae]PLS22430.1 GcrA cell cycle regulator [Amylibacter cionae]